MSATVIAVDVAKSVFEVAVATRPGRVAERHRLTRPQCARFVATQAAATVLMEACGTAHVFRRLPCFALRPRRATVVWTFRNRCGATRYADRLDSHALTAPFVAITGFRAAYSCRSPRRHRRWRLPPTRSTPY